MTTKNIVKISLVSLLLIIGAYGYWQSRTSPIRVVRVGDQMVRVTAVSSPEDLARGLAGVRSLEWDEGMLFLFPARGQYQFWMKDMTIPIDIIWLRDNLVADITRQVPAPTDLQHQDNLPLYSSREPIDSVLEVRSGFADRYSIRIGDKVEFKK